MKKRIVARDILKNMSSCNLKSQHKLCYILFVAKYTIVRLFPYFTDALTQTQKNINDLVKDDIMIVKFSAA